VLNDERSPKKTLGSSILHFHDFFLNTSNKKEGEKEPMKPQKQSHRKFPSFLVNIIKMVDFP